MRSFHLISLFCTHSFLDFIPQLFRVCGVCARAFYTYERITVVCFFSLLKHKNLSCFIVCILRRSLYDVVRTFVEDDVRRTVLNHEVDA